MKKTITLITVFCTMFVHFLSAQWLSVGNPQEEWWYERQGTIEDAVITLEPQGLYLEVGMYLTFSARSWQYTNNDTIEIVCEFPLPDGSFIHDSWLWYNQDTLIADIIDRWTATGIYNEIVGRRQDPSLLYKVWDNYYELRIYPAKGDSTRRVKLSYLTPFSFTANNVSARLPIDIIKSSMFEVEGVEFRVKTDDTWMNPEIIEHPEIEFVDNIHSHFPTNQLLEFDSDDVGYQMTIQFDSPMKNGIFINHLDDEEDFYQLAIMPSSVISSNVSKKVLVCIDYQSDETAFDKAKFLSSIGNSLDAALTEKDSFNLVFAGIESSFVSTGWISADSIHAIFNSGADNLMKDYSNLLTLITDGAKFIKENSGSGHLLLISNSDGNGDPPAANQYIADLQEYIGDDNIKVHCANFCRYSNNYHYVGSVYYEGNEYLYVYLSKFTGGSYVKEYYRDYNAKTFLSQFVYKIDGMISSFDIHTSVQNGFCYSRFNLNNNDGIYFINEPIMQIGKYYGQLPFEIELAGVYRGQPFSETIIISENDMVENDTLLEEIWAGNHIEQLESQADYYSNDIIREIIDYSIEERVLSYYTAFLAIEPGALDDLDLDDINNEDFTAEPINIDEVKEITEVRLKAYPNPFTVELKIEIQLPDNFDDNSLLVQIFDISGRLISKDNLECSSASGILEYTWNGDDENGQTAKKGTYLVVVSGKDFKEVVKVIKMD